MSECLRIPDNFKPSALRLSCGNLMVELVQFLTGRIETLSGEPLPVKSALLGGMLPWDMETSLKALGHAAAIQIMSLKGPTEQLNFLKSTIDRGHSPILFVGMGSGHWLAVWGYDDGKGLFYCFDTSKHAVRDVRGLTIYPYNELLRVWGKRVWITKLITLYRAYFPWWSERLQAEPYTMVVY